MLCRLSLSRKHIATEGGNLKGFQNALLVDPIRSYEADIKLVDLVGKQFPVTVKILVFRKGQTLRSLCRRVENGQNLPQSWSGSVTTTLPVSPLLLK